MSMRKAIFGLILILLVITLPLYAFKVYTKVDYTDFEVYYRSALRAKNFQWNQVYDLGDGASPFRYAPVFLPFFRPFAELALPTARLVWYFLQFFWFGLGFFFLYQTLRASRFSKEPREALWITSLGVLFILRFCLDTFTIGQTSSLLFLGFCVGVYGFVLRRTRLASLGLLIPTLFKIGPGIVYGIFLSSRPKVRRLAWSTPIWAVLASVVATGLWVGSLEVYKTLWMSWTQIVALDSAYFDAAHYGSQSFKSFLLRLVTWGGLSLGGAQGIYLLVAFVLCAGAALFWLLRAPKSLIGRGLFFSLGLFLYMWLMPETFKYSLTPLAIPVVFLLASSHKSLFGRFAIAFGFLTLSFAGKDLVGDFLFFNSQRWSFPFFATVLLGAATFQAAWRESRPSRRVRFFQHSLGPWPRLPTEARGLEVSVLVPVPFLYYEKLLVDKVSETLLSWHSCLDSLNQGQFEIILVPYGDTFSALHPLSGVLHRLSLKYPEIRFLSEIEAASGTPSFSPGGGSYGDALRKGFLASHGKQIFVCQMTQPCEPSFFAEAVERLNQGTDLVRGNRRHPQSRFKTPVRFLSLVYGRYRLGMTLNRFLRVVLPLKTSDSFSGTLGMSWSLAQTAFSLQSSQFFLGHLEISLISLAHQYKETDLPVTITLHHEKPRSQVLGETFQILTEIPRIYSRFRKGYYSPVPTFTAITADDWGISPGVNRGILELAKAGVIRRVSIMANTTYLGEGLRELSALPGVQLGLHLNFTYGRPLSSGSELGAAGGIEAGEIEAGEIETGTERWILEDDGSFLASPAKFLVRWMTAGSRRDSYRRWVEKEFKAQVSHLRGLGVNVQYVDGHHHIHLVPGLLQSLSKSFHELGISTIRLPLDFSLLKTRHAPLVFLALWTGFSARRNGFTSLPCIYPRSKLFKDQGKLRSRLAKAPHSEIIVHPASSDDFEKHQIQDSYTQGRVVEYQALRMLGNGLL